MRTLLSRQLVRPRALFPRTRNANIRRPYSANTQPPSPPEASEAAAAAARKQSRLDRVISRLPGRLQRYLSPLRSAPLTHVTAFLLLHEITAIVPLVGLAATFHYADWLPPYISEGAWVKQGVERFGRYFRRKGWIADDDAVVREAEDEVDYEEGHRARLRRQAGTAWTWGEGGVRLLVEVATAWAVTKALLPLRLGLSVWATPWFARVALQPVGRGFKRIFGGGGGKAPGGGAGKS
ncbi:Mitochondrial seryl-tRNA synthetase protein [Lasiodiplodia theobromae]|uniref:Mitochondrial seryl-tRNA synthetase protein n=1 Tax=Lasiodiplodia theobromae TaxID=45133 RepID=UPI0015C350C6|nr:Mitochondrial seryl-tRNA synthetase protein [Lasiodiplodia theobromae]KAF4544127.1 Mitochondrial seryl-tRNA synthetase protein [Lasiodiplodia theobromae]